jgi:ribosomal protein S18 acetylase RimI-like enzyme
MNIRAALSTDLPQLLALYQQLNSSDPLLSPEQIAEIWTELSASRCCTCFVAEIDKTIVASSVITIIPNFTRGGRSYGVIENVITHCNYRKQGIGTSLMNHLITFAKEKNCYKVMLQSGNARKEAHSFYEKAGFDGNSKKAFELRLL